MSSNTNISNNSELRRQQRLWGTMNKFNMRSRSDWQLSRHRWTKSARFWQTTKESCRLQGQDHHKLFHSPEQQGGDPGLSNPYKTFLARNPKVQLQSSFLHWITKKSAGSAYWEVLTPPQSASSVHPQMLGMLRNLLQRQGLRLEQRPTEDLCLLTVIHSTRLEADISRDSRCLQGEKEVIFFLYLYLPTQGLPTKGWSWWF